MNNQCLSMGETMIIVVGVSFLSIIIFLHVMGA